MMTHGQTVPSVVAAYTLDDGIHAVCWCCFCLAWHWHGRGDGHRLAHCLDKPDIAWHYCAPRGCRCYRERGYILHTVGTITRPVMNRTAREQRRWLKDRLAVHEQVHVTVTSVGRKTFRRLSAAYGWCVQLESWHPVPHEITVQYQRGSTCATVPLTGFLAVATAWHMAFTQEVLTHGLAFSLSPRHSMTTRPIAHANAGSTLSPRKDT